ncbi:hypothetical protein [uncultured Hydrogenophaga sp.]|uniref:hypothetical protein n=1 Tax=uncultured Hydrogenophaga sp. TaxID=199683 RepID=UPI00265E0DDB|nr:hypothetical protein [uncultured Hydrogenophaga sp.]
MNELLSSALSGGVAAAAVAWAGRTWLSERLKQAISHEYSTKLETVRNELSAKLEAVKHAYEVDQLRTSLFFDHQRVAFGEVLAAVVEMQKEWDNVIDPDEDLLDPAPYASRRKLEAVYFKHQLFLDSDLIMSMELLFDFYQDSLPYFNGIETIRRDVLMPFGNASFVVPRLASVFRTKLGIANDQQALRDIALFGAIRLVNGYHFPEIGLPATGALKLDKDEFALGAINKARANEQALVETLQKLLAYIPANRFFHEAEASARRYLAVLER